MVEFHLVVATNFGGRNNDNEGDFTKESRDKSSEPPRLETVRRQHPNFLFKSTKEFSAIQYRCCACPETKSARDECFLKNSTGDADEKCQELVQKHLACMRGYGFNV